jgi:hypothetical protein
MRWRSESQLAALIENAEQELASKMKHLASEASEGVSFGSGAPEDEEGLTSMVELTDLQNELEFVRQNDLNPDSPAEGVRVPLNLSPSLNSGSIALPQPIETRKFSPQLGRGIPRLHCGYPVGYPSTVRPELFRLVG